MPDSEARPAPKRQESKRPSRRVTTPPPPGTDPTPTPEPERHEPTDNDERLRADKPPHY